MVSPREAVKKDSFPVNLESSCEFSGKPTSGTGTESLICLTCLSPGSNIVYATEKPISKCLMVMETHEMTEEIQLWVLMFSIKTGGRGAS